MQLPADYPLKIIPVNFGVKFNPPKLGLEFTNVGQPHIQHIHEISLQGYIERQVDVDQIVDLSGSSPETQSTRKIPSRGTHNPQ